VRNPFKGFPVKRTIVWICSALAVAVLALDLNSSSRLPPFELSYYNKIVGGLSGALRCGYETTYWGEIINDTVLEEINKRAEGDNVYFPLAPADSYFGYLLNDRNVKFVPVVNYRKAKLMLIFGRPFVGFWQMKTRSLFRREGKIPVPIWSLSLDSVPLIQLYLIEKKIRNQPFGVSLDE
jgi:hypothetical protein